MNKNVKSVFQGLAGSFGLTIIPNWRLERYSMATYTKQLFDFLAIDLVLDVGANEGQYRDFLRHEVGYTGWICSFEPTPALVTVLKKRALNDAHWKIEDCALGATEGTANFNVMCATEFSSFKKPAHTTTERYTELNKVQEKVEVSVRTLDSIAPVIGDQVGAKHIYLKLDTQGFDLEIVAGGHKFLQRVEAMQMEASVTPIYENTPDFAVAIKTLQQTGFQPIAFFPNNSGDGFRRLVEFDCLMIAERNAEKSNR